MVEMLLSAVPFWKYEAHWRRYSSFKQVATGYGVGQYECSFTASVHEIVLVDDPHNLFPVCAHEGD